jgi:hypothetical protein
VGLLVAGSSGSFLSSTGQLPVQANESGIHGFGLVGFGPW